MELERRGEGWGCGIIKRDEGRRPWEGGGGL